MGSYSLTFSKMRLSILVLFSILGYCTGLGAIVVVPAVVPVISSTAASVLGLSALAFAKGALIGGLLGRGSGRRRRDLDAQNYHKLVNDELYELTDEEVTVDVIADLETEQCFKRLFCSAATGRLENPALEKTLGLADKAIRRQPFHPLSNKYREAVVYGATRKSIEKCEFHYPCSLSMDQAKQIFS